MYSVAVLSPDLLSVVVHMLLEIHGEKLEHHVQLLLGVDDVQKLDHGGMLKLFEQSYFPDGSARHTFRFTGKRKRGRDKKRTLYFLYSYFFFPINKQPIIIPCFSLSNWAFVIPRKITTIQKNKCVSRKMYTA